MQEKDRAMSGTIKAQCVIGEMDGTMVPIVNFKDDGSLDKRKRRKVGWKEARLSVARKDKSLTKIFLATLGSTPRAGDLLNRCAKRLGYDEETKVHCLGDGALWIQEQVERVFGAQGNYLIDFFHLSEYLSGASEECCPEESKKWLRNRQEEIKEGHIQKVVELLKKSEDARGEKNKEGKIQKCLRYIKNRPGQFKYKEALAEELPIGSGEIESGNRSLIQRRLKIPGAWWKQETAEYMLALCCTRANGDWERYWYFVNPSLTRSAA